VNLLCGIFVFLGSFSGLLKIMSYLSIRFVFFVQYFFKK
jgi:hypothetical protein